MILQIRQLRMLLMTSSYTKTMLRWFLLTLRNSHQQDQICAQSIPIYSPSLYICPYQYQYMYTNISATDTDNYILGNIFPITDILVVICRYSDRLPSILADIWPKPIKPIPITIQIWSISSLPIVIYLQRQQPNTLANRQTVQCYTVKVSLSYDCTTSTAQSPLHLINLII